MKGIAIIGIVFHHWFLYIPHHNYLPVLSSLANILSKIGGTLVHLFFIMSSYGLYISYKKGVGSWIIWAKRRFLKIVIPYWIIITTTYIIVNIFHSILPQHMEKGYLGLSLLSYLFFFRNIYPPSWGLNYAFWFFPVIIGLYIIFPFLIKILEKYGSKNLLIISILITYSSITIFVIFNLPIGHQSAWFLFYIIQFSIGILLAYYSCINLFNLEHLGTFKLIISGIGLYEPIPKMLNMLK